jgi:MoaA/NifB/PqqE/SkfB family radical SAM enzyme
MDRPHNLSRLLGVYGSYVFKKHRLSCMPLKLWIETSSRCNLECPLCLNSSLDADEKKDMDPGLFKDIIDQAAGTVLSINLFHRGEPLMNPHIADMIRYASGSGLKTSLHTNGTLLQGKVLGEILFSNLDHLSFSFDGYSPDVYQKNRKGAEFDKTLKNIISFLEQKKKHGRKLPFTVIQVMAESDDRAKDDFLKNFKGLPLDRIIERKPHNWGGLIQDRTAEGPTGLCTFPWYSLTILHDGRVSICPQDFMGKLIAGDLKKESLSDVFNGNNMAAIRKEMISKAFYRQRPCADCDRIRRRSFLGVPLGSAGTFFRENIARKKAV